MRVLVLECDLGLRKDVISAFTARGHTVTPIDTFEEAVKWIDAGVVDLVVSDIENTRNHDSKLLRSLHAQRVPIPLVLTTQAVDAPEIDSLRGVSTDVLAYPLDERAIDDAIEKAQAHHMMASDSLKVLPYLTERLEFVIPSRVEFLDGILNFFSERLVRRGVIDNDDINVIVALDEAIVNAIKHGNGYDQSKYVTILAEMTAREAVFTITDEGDGFDLQSVPDPCAPENLLRTSGRGLLLIRNIVDDVRYNDRGNSVTMTVRAK